MLYCYILFCVTEYPYLSTWGHEKSIKDEIGVGINDVAFYYNVSLNNTLYENVF